MQMENFKIILSELLKFETVDEIIQFISEQKATLINELLHILPPSFSFIISNFGGMAFDYFINYLKTFESKDELIVKINFYIAQIHEIAISTLHIINGNDNEILQTLANNIYDKLNPEIQPLVKSVVS
jgi:putative flippase GtrA